MLLCVDIGNTQIALGLYAEPDAGGRRRGAPAAGAGLADAHRPADDGRRAGGRRPRRCSAATPTQVTGIAALSTVPSLLRELRLLIERRGDPSVVVGPGVRTGVPLLVDNPREVGADRVMNTLAAHRLFGTACVVVDFGTSTNIDVVSARGEFLGGALAPGIEISLEALATRAAALRSVELVAPALGDRQEHRGVPAVRGALRLRRPGRRAGRGGSWPSSARRPGPVTVLGTGGLAPLMAGESETITDYVPDLTLLGLRLTYLRNARSTSVTIGSSNSARRRLRPRRPGSRGSRPSAASRSAGVGDQRPGVRADAWPPGPRAVVRTGLGWRAVPAVRERGVPGQRRACCRRPRRRGTCSHGVERLAVAAHPLDAVVVAVPHRGQHPARAQHPGRLGQRARRGRTSATPARRAPRPPRSPSAGDRLGRAGQGPAAGNRARSSSSMPSSGSTAVTGPNSSSAAVSFPVPAPRSSRRGGAPAPSTGRSAHSTAARG